MITANLPNKLSDVIMVALEDLVKAERSKRYKVNMDHWHAPNGKCSVCFAGAVMAKCDGVRPSEYIGPSDFSGRSERALRALNFVRLYSFAEMFSEFSGHRTGLIYSPTVTNCEAMVVDELVEYFADPETRVLYDEYPAGFKRNMETIAAILKEHNL